MFTLTVVFLSRW